MKLKSIRIELQDWGSNIGEYEAKVQYVDKSGEVTYILDAKTSLEVLAHLGPVILQASERRAQTLNDAIKNSLEDALSAKALPAPDSNSQPKSQ